MRNNYEIVFFPEVKSSGVSLRIDTETDNNYQAIISIPLIEGIGPVRLIIKGVGFMAGSVPEYLSCITTNKNFLSQTSH